MTNNHKTGFTNILGIYNFKNRVKVLVDKFQEFLVHTKTLTDEEIDILNKYSRHYRALSPHLKYLFQEKLAIFMHARSFEAVGDFEITPKVKVLISSYATQISFAMHDFEYSHFKTIKVHEQAFSVTEGVFQSWYIDEVNDTVHISWQDLYTQVRIRRSQVPLGLELSAWLLQFENREKNFVNIKKSENGQVEFFLNALYHDLAGSNSTVFTDTDLKTYDNFIKACILNFHTNPVQLKNSYPRLFDEMNKLLCSELLLEAA